VAAVMLRHGDKDVFSWQYECLSHPQRRNLWWLLRAFGQLLWPYYEYYQSHIYHVATV